MEVWVDSRLECIKQHSSNPDIEQFGFDQIMDSIRCLRCETDLSSNTDFYTIARNGQMVGFFCSHDCTQESEHQKYLKAYVLRIAQPPSTHKDLVLIPDARVLKQYSEELAKRKIWKEYFS